MWINQHYYHIIIPQRLVEKFSELILISSAPLSYMSWFTQNNLIFWQICKKKQLCGIGKQPKFACCFDITEFKALPSDNSNRFTCICGMPGFGNCNMSTDIAWTIAEKVVSKIWLNMHGLSMHSKALKSLITLLKIYIVIFYKYKYPIIPLHLSLTKWAETATVKPLIINCLM